MGEPQYPTSSNRLSLGHVPFEPKAAALGSGEGYQATTSRVSPSWISSNVGVFVKSEFKV
jgi:hypothetical protein